MSKTQRSQQLLTWLTNEKRKDDVQLSNSKERIIKEIRGLDRNSMFPKPKKINIWTRIRVIIWGK